MVYEEHQPQETIKSNQLNHQNQSNQQNQLNQVEETKEFITKESIDQSNDSIVTPIDDQHLDTLDEIPEDKFIDVTNLDMWNNLKFIEYYLKNKNLLLYILHKYGITKNDIRIKIEIRDNKYQDLIDCINYYKDNIEDEKTE